MTESIEKIRRIANQYTLLTKREEIDLITTLHQARPDHVKTLAILFEEDPRFAQQFYQNYQAKKRSLLYRDMSGWDAIIEAELNGIDELLGIHE